MDLLYSDDVVHVEFLKSQEILAQLSMERIVLEERLQKERISQSRKRRIKKQLEVIVTKAIPRVQEEITNLQALI